MLLALAKIQQFKEKMEFKGFVVHHVHTGGRGAPKVEVLKEQLIFFVDNDFTVPQIALTC